MLTVHRRAYLEGAAQSGLVTLRPSATDAGDLLIELEVRTRKAGLRSISFDVDEFADLAAVVRAMADALAAYDAAHGRDRFLED